MMIKVSSVTPSDFGAILPASNFVDAFEMTVAHGAGSYAFTKHIMASTPAWVGRLLSLRNALMAPFGLHTDEAPSAGEKFGMFPVISTSDARTVLGFDDKHLDFRIILDAAPLAGATKLTLSTAVRTHNTFGKIYLAAVMPFHKVIVRTMLGRAAKLGNA
jgi:Protein of unknown function (DUF2867)